MLHLAGKQNICSDTLSRYPWSEAGALNAIQEEDLELENTLLASVSEKVDLPWKEVVVATNEDADLKEVIRLLGDDKVNDKPEWSKVAEFFPWRKELSVSSCELQGI